MMMRSYNKIVVFQSMLCCLVIIVPCSFQAAPVYLAHICRNTTTNTTNRIFQANRKVLLSTLASNATQNKGYYNYTAGRNNNMAYGLSLCQGDLTAKDCQECVTAATQDITTKCPIENLGVIWYDPCMVRYDSNSFFSSFDERLAVYMWNTGNVTDETQFQQALTSTLNGLRTRASEGKPLNNQVIKSFALGSANISALQTLYSLAQCIPDLAEADCNRCLQEAINLLQRHNNSQGGRALFASCIVRYELYSFYKNIPTAPPPSPRLLPPPPRAPPSSLTTPKGNGGKSSKVVVAIVAPICVALLIFFLGSCYIIRRAKKMGYTQQEETGDDEITTIENLKFELGTIEAATNNFSPDNKIGAGGFGDVFKI